jgi:hypothetical protein
MENDGNGRKSARFTHGRDYVPEPWNNIKSEILTNEEIDCFDSLLPDAAVKKRIGEGMARLVYKIACSTVTWYANQGTVLNGTRREEIVSAGFCGLMAALNIAHKRERPQEGDKLSTYLSACIEAEMHKFVFQDRIAFVPRETNRDRIAKGKEPYADPEFEPVSDDLENHWKYWQPLTKTAALVDEWDSIEFACETPGEWELCKLIGDYHYMGNWYTCQEAAEKLRIPRSSAYWRRNQVKYRFELEEAVLRGDPPRLLARAA